VGFSEHLASLLAQKGDARAIQYDGGWLTWQDAGRIAAGIDAALMAAGLGAGATVGLVMRDRPWTVAGFYALLATRRGTLMFAGRTPDRVLGEDVASLRPAALIADSEDWRRAFLVEKARAAGAVGIELTHDTAEPLRLVQGLERPDAGPHHRLPLNTAVTMLTSGTTGPAKRIPVSYAELDQRLARARASSGVAINALPLHNMGGIFGLVDAVVRSRPVSIMERFDVWRWAELIREHKPRQTGSPPAVLRMVLEAAIPPEYFASVRSHVTASAPLDPQVAREFEARYGVPCFQSWGATEMKGSATGWSSEDRKRFKDGKLGSCGRALPGTKLRIVDPETSAPCPVGADGRIEVWRADFPGDDHWMTTSDLGHLDQDGFLWVKGRLDDVIIRGGLKVEPKDVEDALQAHPCVVEAVVVGLPDERLGEVPAGVVVTNGELIVEEQLIAWVRERLPAYKVPVRLVQVDTIPRNAMMKVERSAVRANLQAGR